MPDDTTVYNANDVAAILNIKLSTLRKYANVLHKAGYHFHKNERGYRGYFERDVIVIRRLIETKNHPDMTLEQSANAVMSWVTQGDMSSVDTDNKLSNERYISYDEFATFKDQQEGQMQNLIDLNKTLIDRFDKQQEYLDNRMKQRDEWLVKTMNEVLETKRQIAAAQKEEAESQQKTSFLKRIFSKKRKE